jgi:hypothetical protein
VLALPSHFQLTTGSLSAIDRLAFFAQPAGRRRGSPQLDWPASFAIWQSEADVFLYWWQVFGSFLTGSDLRYSNSVSAVWAGETATYPVDREPPDLGLQESAPVALAQGLVTPPLGGGPRPPGQWIYSADFVERSGAELPVWADIAFAAITGFDFPLGGPPRELDVEVSVARYDGTQIVWQIGYGASTQSSPGDPDEGHLIRTTAAFGAIQSRASRLAEDIRVRDAIFRARPGTVALAPEHFGAVVNAGERPLVLTGVAIDGPAASDFDVVVGRVNLAALGGLSTSTSLRGARVFTIGSFYDHVPVRLAPGEALVVGGRVLPREGGVRRARLVFSTNARRVPAVEIALRNHPSAERPAASLVPGALDFRNVQLGAQRTRSALITSDGLTPLLVYTVSVQAPDAGFAVGINPMASPGAFEIIDSSGRTVWQVGSGSSLLLEASFRPRSVGRASARLVVETDAGTLHTTLSARGVL